MINTILFDLDGTVLPMDFNKFMKIYFYELGDYLKEYIEPTLLNKYVMECTEVMVKNTDFIKNEDVFMNHFESLMGEDITKHKAKFLEFYDSLFDNVKASTYVSKEMQESISVLKDKGYTIALATNPLFPMIANHHRIRWAGFSPEDFSYISSFENNYYCKPNPLYYEEVLTSISKSPSECMMIGNDVFDDLAAKKLGIKTYLIENHMLNKYDQEIITDYKGDYGDFLTFVKNLPKL